MSEVTGLQELVSTLEVMQKGSGLQHFSEAQRIF